MTSPWLKATVFLWWLLSLTESVQNSDSLTEPARTTNWAIARKYLRFIELTMFQLLVGGIATASWLKVVHKKSFHPKGLNSTSVAVVTILNLVGNLAMNFADSTHTRRTRDAFRSWEAVIMFALLVSFGYRRTYHLSSSVLVGVTAMAVGSWSFLRSWEEDGFNFCGIIAALASGIAFSLRNIILKGLGDTWHGPLQKYCVMSIYGSLALAPLALAKLIVTRILPLVQPDVLLKSTAFHCARGFTSIVVLETVFPLLHAVLGIAVRFSVTMVTVTTVTAYERLPWSVLAGSTAFAAGLSFYSVNGRPRGADGLKRTIVYFVLVLHFLFSSRLLFLKFTLKSTSDAKPKTFVTSRRLVRTFWIYDEPPSDEVLVNIETIQAQIPSVRIHVHCGTFLCVEKIRGIRNPEIEASFLKFREILRGSPLERWFSRHPLHKVLSGSHFENHVHEAVLLALLWHHGDATIDPFLRIHEAPVRELGYTSPWVSFISDNGTGGMLRACNFTRRHPFVTMLARLFVKHHSDAIDSRDELKNFVLDFHNTTSRALLRFCLKSPKHCPTILGIKSSVLKERKGKSQFVVVSEKSIADLSLAIENLANVQFLPFVYGILGNDRYEAKFNKSSTTGFVSSAWTGNRSAWTFLRNMNYVLLSAKIDYRNRPSSDDVDNLRRRAPVGCFDSETVKFLRNNGIKAFYLGGISLLAENLYSSRNPRNGVYLIDVDEEVKKRLPFGILRNAISVNLTKWDHFQPNRRSLFQMAYDVIEKYSTAKLIITQNVRCALASAAVNTPVIYINSTDIPGARSELVKEVPEVFHIVEPRRLFEDDIGSKLITNSNPEGEVFANPNASLLMRLRATAWSVIRKHTSLRDSALRFGVVPFPRVPRAAPSNTTTVHLIFTTSARTSITLGGLEDRETVEGTFMWRHWRCVEAVFYHHPFAKVVIHSNTLSQATFDVLTEAGYNIRVESYDLTELAKGTPAEAFVREELPYAREGEHWYSHETDLLRLLILFKRGGVYMDTDIIVVRSLSDLPTNVVGWESSLNMNGAFLKFQKGHPFLEACIRKYSRHYSQAWSENGPLLISRVWRDWSVSRDGGGNVSAVHREAFYMFSYREIKKECFEETSGRSYKRNLKILRSFAYVVHLYSKVTAAYGTKERRIKEGTLCKHILNSFCVLCDDVY